MSTFKEKLGKFRLVIEIALLLTLAVYVTVQANELRNPPAAPPVRPVAATTSTVPEVLNYQGFLTDSGGTPLDGSYAIKFSIYDAVSNGTELWTESHINVQVNDGQVAVLLGETVPFSPTLFVDHKDTFIGVTVGSDPEMTPRQRIHSVPYCMHCDDGVPRGEVIAYIPRLGNGDPCPSGYVLADGNNGTPDLSGLFLVASGNGFTVEDSDPFPKHTHRVAGETSHEDDETRMEDGNGQHVADNNHRHTFDVTSYNNSQPALPPYYVVNFCIKQ